MAVVSHSGPWLLLGPVLPGDIARGHGKGGKAEVPTCTHT